MVESTFKGYAGSALGRCTVSKNRINHNAQYKEILLLNSIGQSQDSDWAFPSFIGMASILWNNVSLRNGSDKIANNYQQKNKQDSAATEKVCSGISL